MDPGAAQARQWLSEFGKAYTGRNELRADELDTLYRGRYGVARTDLNRTFLEGLPRSMRILEVGANTGNQLLLLRKMGFTRLAGVDVQRDALLRIRSRGLSVDAIMAAGQFLPFSASAFDLVFTSGLLIHIPPSAVELVLTEIHRCSRSFIWGLEYYDDRYTEVEYRERQGMMWKTDFAELYLKQFEDLELIRRRRLKYLKEGLEDEMFLLRKRENHRP